MISDYALTFPRVPGGKKVAPLPVDDFCCDIRETTMSRKTKTADFLVLHDEIC